MAINLNFNAKPDYGLRTGLVDEMIRMYGTQVRFVPTRKIQDFSDWYIGENGGLNRSFDDFKTVIPTDLGVQEFFVLLNETEGFPNGLNFAFTQFGLHNEDTLQVFVSLKSLEFLSEPDNRTGSDNVSDFSGSLERFGNIKRFDNPEYNSTESTESTDSKNSVLLELPNYYPEHESKVVHPRELISNLIIFPNGKVMEITDCQLHVPGTANKFVYSNLPSCYMLSLKSYSFDRSAVSKGKKLAKSVEILDSTVYGKDSKDQEENSKLSEFFNFEQPDQKTLHGTKNETDTANAIDRFFERQDTRSENIQKEMAEDVLSTDSRTLEDKVKNQKVDDVFGIFG